jgi:hypothetical protein
MGWRVAAVVRAVCSSSRRALDGYSRATRAAAVAPVVNELGPVERVVVAGERVAAIWRESYRADQRGEVDVDDERAGRACSALAELERAVEALHRARARHRRAGP